MKQVAPRAGAWIETHNWPQGWRRWMVAPRAGAWIETVALPTGVLPVSCRAPCGRVD